MIKHLVFDYGNVLVRFNPNWLYTKVFNGDAKRSRWFNEVVLPQSWVTRLDAGEPMSAVIAERQALFPEYAGAIAAYDSRYYEMVGAQVAGMEPLLRRLRREGFGLWGLTNWPPKVYHVLATRPIFALLDGMVISCEERLVKPHPDIYRTLLARYDLQADECLFTDDRAENVLAAEQIGFHGIVFKSAAQFEADLRAMF